MVKQTAVTLGLVCALAAAAGAQTQTAFDGSVTLIQRDVPAGDDVERWAITHDPERNTATGNIFFPGGGDAAFVFCEILGQDGDNFNLDCFGADACPSAPCTPAEWDPLGPVTLPASFLSPPNGEPLTANPCPADMERAGADCIDRDIRAGQNYTNATITCHNIGRSICSAGVLMACDSIPLSIEPGAPVSCGDATDEGAGRVMWTNGQQAPFGTDIFSNVVCYAGNNQAIQCDSADIHEFFCCQPARQ
jgi:hypothetical protein